MSCPFYPLFTFAHDTEAYKEVERLSAFREPFFDNIGRTVYEWSLLVSVFFAFMRVFFAGFSVVARSTSRLFQT